MEFSEGLNLAHQDQRVENCKAKWQEVPLHFICIQIETPIGFICFGVVCNLIDGLDSLRRDEISVCGNETELRSK